MSSFKVHGYFPEDQLNGYVLMLHLTMDSFEHRDTSMASWSVANKSKINEIYGGRSTKLDELPFAHLKGLCIFDLIDEIWLCLFICNC